MIGIVLLNNADKALATWDIKPLAASVVIEVVSIVHARDTCDRRTAVRIEHYQLRWLSGHYEYPVIGFIQRHRKIGLPRLQGPINHLVRRAIDHHNLRFGSDVGVDRRS